MIPPRLPKDKVGALAGRRTWNLTDHPRLAADPRSRRRSRGLYFPSRAGCDVFLPRRRVLGLRFFGWRCRCQGQSLNTPLGVLNDLLTIRTVRAGRVTDPNALRTRHQIARERKTAGGANGQAGRVIDSRQGA